MWRLVSQTAPRRQVSLSSMERGRRSSTDPDFVEHTVMDAAQDLGRYRDAVLSAIQRQFDGIYDTLAEDERDLVLQKAIQRKVADAVEFCQA